MNKDAIPRREFVGISTAVAGASLAARPVWPASRSLLDQEPSQPQTV
jgi:hypothetical protein